MYLGERLSLGSSLTDENMAYLKQLGVNYLMVTTIDMSSVDQKGGMYPVPKLRQGDYYDTNDLVNLKNWVESHGLRLFSINQTPFRRWDKIILGRPGRDEQIENWCKSLRNIGKAGIPLLHYNWMINTGAWLPLWRTTADTVGRGGARIVGFDYELVKNAPATEFGEITEKAMWDNLTYFLKAVIPVAEESHVKMVMHPADPQVPSIAGIARIIRSAQAYDRLFDITRSDYNCMVFCLGCFSQILDSDGVYDAIRHFGGKGKIGYVDFRNVKGTLEKFNEVYPDEGKLDMLKAIEILKKVGYRGYIVPDHAPHGTGDTEYGHIGHAFQIGYLKGLLQGASALD